MAASSSKTSSAGAAARRIVVTGCTRGLGRALVERFVALGHTVAGCGRSAERIAALQRAYPAPHRFAAADVANDSAMAAFARGVLEQMGPPDLLVNNAGLINRPAPLWKVPAEEFDAVVAVNLSGIANAIRHFVPAMVAAGRGTIVNFSSGWGRSTAPEVAPYCATKWGVEGLTQALAAELPGGLAAVALNPGVIDTDMLRTCWGDGAGSFAKPARWATKAADFILQLGPRHNGRPVTVGGFEG